MAKFTEEQLKKLDKDMLFQMLLHSQEQLESIDQKLQLVLEQLAVSKRNRFGRSSEKLGIEHQIAFMEVDGEIVFFNEAEAVVDLEVEELEETKKARPKKKQGKRDEDLKNLPVEVITHEMSEEELIKEFGGKDTFKRLPDEAYRRYKFIPAKISVEEHHVAVYASKVDEHMKKADHPVSLLKGSLVSPSLEAALLNGKYVNAVPLYRLEKEFERYGVAITRQNMANWTILCAERYLSIFYDYLQKKLLEYHVIQADETPVLVNKDARKAGSKSYMWVYRTGSIYKEQAIILYEDQRTRNTSHPREFLKEFQGVCVTDGYQVYHTLEKEKEDSSISGCWAHARRRFDEAVKALHTWVLHWKKESGYDRHNAWC